MIGCLRNWLKIVNLIEYLKMRREVEQAPIHLVREAQELAEIVKTRNLTTIDQMWQALIEEAEKRYPGPPKLNIFK